MKAAVVLGPDRTPVDGEFDEPNALAVRELAVASRRVDNARLLAGLGDRPVDIDGLMDDLDVGRGRR